MIVKSKGTSLEFGLKQTKNWKKCGMKRKECNKDVDQVDLVGIIIIVEVIEDVNYVNVGIVIIQDRLELHKIIQDGLELHKIRHALGNLFGCTPCDVTLLLIILRQTAT